MLSKKLVGTLGVLAATAMAPATVAHAAPKPAPTDAAHVLHLGTQVGSEGIRSPQADGIIAILIGVHGCPNCPHPAVNIAGDGIGVSYPLRSSSAPSGNSEDALTPARHG